MEGENKSLDIDKMFTDVEKAFEKYNSVDSGNIFEKGKKWEALSAEVVSGLTDIRKNAPKMPDSKIVDRVCEFTDMLSRTENGVLWEFVRDEKDGEVLISFLKELATKGCISQIDKIFRTGGGYYPLVNIISCEHKEKFNELFSKLPEDYQNKLLGETISYEEGDKTFTFSLIGGTALMGF